MASDDCGCVGDDDSGGILPEGGDHGKGYRWWRVTPGWIAWRTPAEMQDLAKKQFKIATLG